MLCRQASLVNGIFFLRNSRTGNVYLHKFSILGDGRPLSAAQQIPVFMLEQVRRAFRFRFCSRGNESLDGYEM
jgi:hypothetical protein